MATKKSAGKRPPRPVPKKPLKTGPSAPRRGARYLTQAETKEASKGSGYKTKDIQYRDENQNRLNLRQLITLVGPDGIAQMRRVFRSAQANRNAN